MFLFCIRLFRKIQEKKEWSLKKRVGKKFKYKGGSRSRGEASIFQKAEGGGGNPQGKKEKEKKKGVKGGKKKGADHKSFNSRKKGGKGTK